MANAVIAIAGSSGLIGSDICEFFHRLGWKVKGVDIDKARDGDHICYFSDLSKISRHYSRWTCEVGLWRIFEGLVDHWRVIQTTAANR